MIKPLPTRISALLAPPNEGFQYFEHVDSHPFQYGANGYQPANAWWLAECSLLAYAKQDFVAKALYPTGLRVLKTFSGESTQCYVAHGDDFAVVAFRGTEIQSLDGINDIFANVKFNLVESEQGGDVHNGFKGALDEVWDEVADYLAPLAGSVYFTGHSLGGALAILAADRHGDTSGVYVYGAPRVGNDEFAEDYHEPTFRFINNSDVVPHLPPRIPLPIMREFVDVGELKYIDRKGDLTESDGRWERLHDAFLGHLGHLFNDQGQLKLDKILKVPIDGLLDHAPILYALHLWNNHVRGNGEGSSLR